MSAPAVVLPRRRFEALYREHFAFVWRSLRRLGVREADLPDATQDVFLVAYRRLADFDGQSRVTTWLYAICFRIASDRRRRASHRYEELAPPPAPAAAVGGQADAELERAERRALLQRALDGMSDEQRAVFVLFELEGWSGERIAEALDVPLATAHSRLRLAREQFRKFLAAWRARERFDELHRGGVR